MSPAPSSSSARPSGTHSCVFGSSLLHFSPSKSVELGHRWWSDDGEGAANQEHGRQTYGHSGTLTYTISERPIESAAGINLLSTLIELVTMGITINFSLSKGFPFSTYGEYAFIPHPLLALANPAPVGPSSSPSRVQAPVARLASSLTVA